VTIQIRLIVRDLVSRVRLDVLVLAVLFNMVTLGTRLGLARLRGMCLGITRSLGVARLGVMSALLCADAGPSSGAIGKVVRLLR
jgi:hypothetical protein